MSCTMISQFYMNWYSMVDYVWYGMVWYGMVWYGMVWYGIIWYGMVWYGMVWYGMVWYGMVWYGMVWYGILGHWDLLLSTLLSYKFLFCSLTILIQQVIFSLPHSPMSLCVFKLLSG